MVLKDEFYLIQQWFDKYDQLIKTSRGWLITLYVAIVSYTIGHNQTDHLSTLLAFAVFLYCGEVFWLYRYWTKRACRYTLIQDVFNGKIETLDGIALLDPDNRFGEWCGAHVAKRYGRLKKTAEKLDEPTLFYLGLCVILAWLL